MTISKQKSSLRETAYMNEEIVYTRTPLANKKRKYLLYTSGLAGQ